MTDKFKEADNHVGSSEKSFKDQILAEMEAASRQREEHLAEDDRRRREAAMAAQQAEAAKQEAERQAQLAEREAQRQLELEAEMADLARREQEAKERALKEAEAEARVLAAEAERQARLAEMQQRHQEEMDEMARREEEARELARLEAERRQELAKVETPEEREQIDLVYEAEREVIRRELERDESLSATAIPDFSDTTVFESSDLLADQTTAINLDALADTGYFAPMSDLSSGAMPTRGADKIDFDQLDGLDRSELVSADEDYIVAGDAIRRQKRQATNSLAKKISMVLSGTIVVLLLVTLFFGYRYVSSALGPLDATSTDYVQVEIPVGSGNRLIGQILEEEGVIKSGTVFNYYAKFKNYTDFRGGYYNFQKNMSLDDIAKLLQQGGTAEPVAPPLGKIVIPEGYTLEQIGQAVAVNGASKEQSEASPFNQADFMAVVTNPDFIARMVEKYPNLLSELPASDQAKYQLEGYLYPATYAYYEGTTLEGLVEEMIAAMDTNLAPHYAAIAARGMSVNDVLTLASLVEKEGASDEDRKQIASVFYNRLAVEMPLQSNIAILYAMGKLGQETTLAEDAAIDTAIESPYNIYANPGLMPGPVDSPSLKAVEATIYPAETPYLYFVADVSTGQVHYAETFEEHSANVEKYINSRLD